MVVCGIDSFEKNLLPSVNKLAKSLYNSVWRTLASGELSEVHTGISTVPKLWYSFALLILFNKNDVWQCMTYSVNFLQTIKILGNEDRL